MKPRRVSAARLKEKDEAKARERRQAEGERRR